MKKIVLTLLLMTGMVQAQIITNFDPGFKNILVNYVTVDTNNDGIADDNSNGYLDANHDGEIQVSEAQAVKSLVLGYFSGSPFMSYALQSVAGIENFTNVTYLDCHYNKLTSLDVSGMPQLQTLKCSENKLTSLNVSGLTNLKYLDFSYNELTSFDATGLTNLATLKCFNNQLTTLVVENLTKLEALDCHVNSLTKLSLTGLYGVFKNLDCGFNSIPTLDVTPFDLTSLKCQYNQLSVLELPYQRSLQILECYDNKLTTLDVSNCYSLLTLQCSSNQLTSLIMKNGSFETSGLGFSGNPNLAFICVDDAEMNAVQALATSYGLTNCAVDSYCTFVPGGLNNVIYKGYLNFNEDSVCLGSNSILANNVRLDLSDNNNTVVATKFVNKLSNDIFYTHAGNFKVTPVLENPSYFNITASFNTINFPSNSGDALTFGFCLSPNGIHQNIEGVVVSIIPAQPGIDAVYRVYFKNAGNATLPFVVFNLNHDQSRVNFVSASEPNNKETFSFNDLKPFEIRFVDITFHINSETDASPVHYGDELAFNLIYTPYGEESAKGYFTYNQPVKQQYASNEVLCLQGEQLPASKIGDYLYYAFYFENTGTADAKNVVVREDIDATKFDLDSLQLIDSSSSVDARLTGNILEFIFQDINVKPKGGRGHILLKIKTKGSLKNGDSVSKKSNVYFDYLFPISSPEQTVTFADLGLTDSNKDISVAVYPNPVANTVFVTSDHEIKKMELYDIQGRLLQTQNGDALQNQLNIQQHPNGVYLLKVTTTKGLYVDQLIKQ